MWDDLSPEAVTKVQPKCILVKTIAKLAPGKSQPSNSLSAWLANRFVPKLFLNLIRNFMSLELQLIQKCF